jgi:hypothetical protein
MYRLLQSRHSDLNFDGVNQMPHRGIDLDFNFNADDIHLDVNLSIEEKVGNTPCPDFEGEPLFSNEPITCGGTKRVPHTLVMAR